MDNFEKKLLSEDISDRLIGLTETEAMELSISTGFPFRVTRKDNINYVITCDYQIFRINVEIDNNLVTKVNFG